MSELTENHRKPHRIGRSDQSSLSSFAATQPGRLLLLFTIFLFQSLQGHNIRGFGHSARPPLSVFRCSNIEPIKSECGHGHITDTMVGPAAPAARPPGCQQKVRHWYGQRHHSQAELQLHRKFLGPVREHLAAKENRGTKNKRQWLKGTTMWFRFPKSDVACVTPCW